MVKTFTQPGVVVTVTAPATVKSGEAVLVGQLFGIAQHDADSGDPVEIGRMGAYNTGEATSAETWAQGELVYWDDSGAGEFSNVAGVGKLLVGCVHAAKSSGTTDGEVLLDGTLRPDEA